MRVSAGGTASSMDNVRPLARTDGFEALLIERPWRSLEYEAAYLHETADGFTTRRVIGGWIDFNTERPHSALGGGTLAETYRGCPPVDMMDKPLRASPTSPQAQQQQQEDVSKAYWWPEHQPEYISTNSPNCPTNRGHLTSHGS